jgi:hypothetical protein
MRIRFVPGMNHETHLIMSPEEVDQLRILAKAALSGDADLSNEESDAVCGFREKLFLLIPLYSDKELE